MYKNAMIGTIFSVTAAILFTPPKNTNPAKIATITPVSYTHLLYSLHISFVNPIFFMLPFSSQTTLSHIFSI